jgi:hypothetical protein
MSHLSLETLARLVDETPSPVESAHLELCAACRGELEGMRTDATALAALPDIEPPVGSWGALEGRLAEEGLLSNRRRRGQMAPLLRMAAGILLFVMGTGTGLFIASRGDAAPRDAVVASAEPGTAAHDTGRLVAQPPSGRPGAGELSGGQEQPAAPPVAAPQPQPEAVAPEARRPVRLASTGAPAAAPRTSEEALDFMRDAESRYLEALTHYAELTGAFDSGDPAARLAALEGIVLTTRAALGQAPADPIINGYHMTALAQREATLRQIAAASNNTWF